MADRQEEPNEIPRHPFGVSQPGWRLWAARLTIFSVTFALLLVVLSAVGGIVEKFFILLYTE